MSALLFLQVTDLLFEGFTHKTVVGGGRTNVLLELSFHSLPQEGTPSWAPCQASPYLEQPGRALCANAHSCQVSRSLCFPRAVGDPAGIIASSAPSREAWGQGSLAWLRMKGKACTWQRTALLSSGGSAVWVQRKLCGQRKVYGR